MKKYGLELNCIFASEVKNQTTASGEILDGQTYWLRLKTDMPEENPASIREGKLFVPKEYTDKLICLYSGTPGENVVALEKKFVNNFLREGYMVWVPRHNGMKLHPGVAPIIVDSKEREDAINIISAEVTGKKLNNYYRDLLNEPRADLEVFGRQNKINKILLIGHSFGASSISHSLIEMKKSGQEDILSKVDKFISLSGFYGDGIIPEKNDEILGGTRFKMSNLVDAETQGANKFYEFNNSLDSHDIKEQLFNIIKEPFEPANKLPGNIKFISVISPTDKYLTLDGAIKHFNHQDKGLLIVDLTHSSLHPKQVGENRIFGVEFEEPDSELIATANKEAKKIYGDTQHSLPNLAPETLVKLAKLTIAGKRKIVCRAQ